MTRQEELVRLREEQHIAAEAYRGPVNDWYNKQGAWQGVTDLLLEEVFILLEQGSDSEIW